MYASTTECAFCGEEFSETLGTAFEVPSRCLGLMKNSEDIDLSDVEEPVSVHLCDDDAPIAKKMVTEYGETPLPECDAKFVDIKRRSDLEDKTALLSMDREDSIDAEDLQRDNLEARLVRSAKDIVNRTDAGNADRVLDSDILEARVIVLSMEELGALN